VDGLVERHGVRDLCATLATGREHRAVRRGGFVRSAADVRALLRRLRDGDPPRPDVPAPGRLCLHPFPQADPAAVRALVHDPALQADVRALTEHPVTAAALAGMRDGQDGTAGTQLLVAHLALRRLLAWGVRPGELAGRGVGALAALTGAGALDPA